MLDIIDVAFFLILYPNAKGYRNGWFNVKCSRNTEWQCVDEEIIDNKDYLRTSGTSKETFLFSDTGLTNEKINGITIFYYAQQDYSRANSCFEAMIRSNRRDYLSGNQLCVGNSWQYVSHTYELNPATGLQWTASEVDSLEAGMHALNPNGGGKISQVYVLVEYEG